MNVHEHKSMNVQQSVHELFMNIPEQQIGLFMKFMSSRAYYVHELGLFMNGHEIRKFMNQIVNEHS